MESNLFGSRFHAAIRSSATSSGVRVSSTEDRVSFTLCALAWRFLGIMYSYATQLVYDPHSKVLLETHCTVFIREAPSNRTSILLHFWLCWEIRIRRREPIPDWVHSLYQRGNTTLYSGWCTCTRVHYSTSFKVT